jgi:V/A-type H+-transporting ATPase subunit I
MIVDMKKISLVVLDSTREESLKALRGLGVLHLEFTQGRSDDLSELEEKRDYLTKSLLLLPKEKGGDAKGGPAKGRPAGESPAGEESAAGGTLEKACDTADNIARLFERERALKEEIARIRQERERLAAWGSFDPSSIRELAERGIRIRLLTLRRKEADSLAEELPLFVISEDKAAVRAAVVEYETTKELRGRELSIPEEGIVELDRKIAEKEGDLAETAGSWNELAGRRALLIKGLSELTGLIAFERAGIAMKQDGPLAFLTGYAPEDQVEALRKLAGGQGWALLEEDPEEGDPVPTLVRNPKWIRIISPVFKLLGTVPGYREHDISFWFLLFFSIFFAMIIGDAGYGVLFLVLTLLARWRFKGASAEPFFLLLVTAACTIVWGALTGTWFGGQALARLPPFSLFIVEGIASFPKADLNTGGTIMRICFVLGAAHLSVARILGFIKRLPRLAAYAELGWLAVIWAVFLLVRIIVMGDPSDRPVLPWIPIPASLLIIVLLGTGLLLVTLFAEQRGKFFKGLALGLGKLMLKLLDSISTFSHVISYVRLFAVGLATVEVARSFNDIAVGVGLGFPAGLGAALILFFGHALNILMGAMSLVVHGVRLNMLEFSGHLGMEWAGVAYDPFREER